MRSFILCLGVIAGCGQVGLARADGLVFQLPADGAWALYAVKTDGNSRIGELKQEVATTGTLTVSSVGRVTRTKQTYRWLELKAESKSEGAYPKLVLKMLIPEKRLQRGQDPLAHSVLTFFDPKPIDEKKAPLLESFIDDGFNRIQYEIDRFRADFPKPLYDSKSLERETVVTPAGRFEDCEILTGTTGYDGPLIQNGRSVFQGKYRITIHPRAPFGVVAMSMESNGREIGEEDEEVLHVTFTRTLTLMATGENAVSDLPARPAK